MELGMRHHQDRRGATETLLVPGIVGGGKALAPREEEEGSVRVTPSGLSCRPADCSGWRPPLLVWLPGPGHASACRAPLDSRRCLLAVLRSGLRSREPNRRCPSGAGARSLSGSRTTRGWARAGAVLRLAPWLGACAPSGSRGPATQ